MISCLNVVVFKLAYSHKAAMCNIARTVMVRQHKTVRFIIMAIIAAAFILKTLKILVDLDLNDKQVRSGIVHFCSGVISTLKVKRGKI